LRLVITKGKNNRKKEKENFIYFTFLLGPAVWLILELILIQRLSV